MRKTTRVLLERIAETLKGKGWTISVAESCTGGMLGEFLTHLPGSSSFFLGGVIAYTPESKISLLGVSREDLKRFGAVSKGVAEQMAVGVQKAFGSDFALSVTGVAGPDPDPAGTPVGTVYIGLCHRYPGGNEEVVLSQSVSFGHSSRDSIRKQSAHSALELLWKYLKNL